MEEFFLETIEAPYFEKGTAWSYSTSGYLLLRMIIEKATGGTVAEAYRHYVLQPVGLTHTYTCPGDVLPSTWAHGWFDRDNDGSYDDFYAVDNTTFCWFNESFVGGHRVEGHGGNAPGYAAGMLYLPDYGVVLSLMDNTEEGEAMIALEPILDVIMDHLLGN
jgi:CubicO group peptidase (beta-lactamase class C family)